MAALLLFRERAVRHLKAGLDLIERHGHAIPIKAGHPASLSVPQHRELGPHARSLIAWDHCRRIREPSLQAVVADRWPGCSSACAMRPEGN